ncbi:unnamed protein product, partial [Hapterophycus canaliculatus]
SNTTVPLCSLDSQGKYTEADPLYVRAIGIEQRTIGRHHPEHATTLSNRAALLERQGKFAEAELLCKESQAIREKTLGQEHLDVANSLNNRGVLLKRQARDVSTFHF